MSCGMFLDNTVTLETCVYLSVSDVVGGGVDSTGDNTGLVSMGAPFKRPALTSATLHGRTGTWFCLLKWVSKVIIWTEPYLNMWFYHGFTSSSVSAWVSLLRCNQLASPFSLVRTLVLRNTDALSPSETQTRACHIPTGHLRYIIHTVGCLTMTS